MTQLNSFQCTVFRRLTLGIAIIALAACSQRAAPKVGEPLPPPGTASPQPYSAPNPYGQTYNQQAGPKDAVLRGAAYLQSGGSTQLPPGSRMTVRLYDAQSADVNRPIAERVYTTNGQGLPWAYELRVPLESMRTLNRPAVAARIEGPNGEPLYLNEQAVQLSEGSADDIPMVRAGAGGFSQRSAPSADPYADLGGQRQRAQPSYGIPKDDLYNVPSYESPVYPGQSYGSTNLSAPPLNAPGVF